MVLGIGVKGPDAGDAERLHNDGRGFGLEKSPKKMKSKSEVVKKVKSTFFFTIFGRFEMP